MRETFNDVAQRGRRSDSLQKQEIEAMPPSFGQADASRTIGSGRPGFLPTCHLACTIQTPGQ